jgi:hypothetical protein
MHHEATESFQNCQKNFIREMAGQVFGQKVKQQIMQ